MSGLKAVVAEAVRVGAKALYLDGSFVTDKKSPGDWDALLIVPVSYNAASPAGAALADRPTIRRAHGGDLFVVSEGDGDVVEHYLKNVFTLDREGRPKGILRIRLKGMEVDDGSHQG
jgi:hypothetical protein